MAKFNLDNYELVEDRLKKFWKDNPEGRINTDVVSSSDDGTMVIVKAELFINKNDDTPVSSGLAQETKGLGGFANNEAWLENCESSAIGRALANWKYQGNKKPRPTQEEMKKVVEDTPKKKEVAQETGTPHSRPKITEATLKQMVFTSCNDNVDFSKKCYKDCMNRTIIKTNQDDIALWEDETIKIFLDYVDDYIAKHEGTFKERESNDPIVNKVIEGMEVEVEVKDMDFDNDDWKAGKEADPMTDAQEGFLKSLITQAIDSGLDELGAQAKQYLNSDKTSKVTCSDWINKLKNAIDNANG